VGLIGVLDLLLRTRINPAGTGREKAISGNAKRRCRCTINIIKIPSKAFQPGCRPGGSVK
jgi:hypothetical protein